MIEDKDRIIEEKKREACAAYAMFLSKHLADPIEAAECKLEAAEILLKEKEAT